MEEHECEKGKYLEMLKHSQEMLAANLAEHDEIIHGFSSELKKIEEAMARKAGLEALLSAQMEQKTGAENSLALLEKQIAEAENISTKPTTKPTNGNGGSLYPRPAVRPAIMTQRK